MGQRVRIYRTKQRTKREETALWAVEEAAREAKSRGVPHGHSRTLNAAVGALLAVLEEELS
jgi:hypothetical protein